mmetsp:Transcript_54695/g.125001  ORF Transcript_54695/g.125001 Transcript_54695/m.125001 type:complete len:241 (+) Transcript_54695:176-898(+)
MPSPSCTHRASWANRRVLRDVTHRGEAKRREALCRGVQLLDPLLGAFRRVAPPQRQREVPISKQPCHERRGRRGVTPPATPLRLDRVVLRRMLLRVLGSRHLKGERCRFGTFLEWGRGLLLLHERSSLVARVKLFEELDQRLSRVLRRLCILHRARDEIELGLEQRGGGCSDVERAREQRAQLPQRDLRSLERHHGLCEAGVENNRRKRAPQLPLPLLHPHVADADLRICAAAGSLLANL